jgi:hypothetical protein
MSQHPCVIDPSRRDGRHAGVPPAPLRAEAVAPG